MEERIRKIEEQQRKNKKNTILIIFVTAILFSTIGVAAGSYSAKQMTYTPSDSNWKVNNVSDAIDDLKFKKVSNNYSTEEQVIGTWIDGRKIYQKTMQITTPNSTGDVKIIDYNSISSNLNSIIKADGFILDSKGGTNIPSYYGGDTWCELTWDSSTSGIYMRATNTLVYARRTAYITIQYTKTTDEATN